MTEVIFRDLIWAGNITEVPKARSKFMLGHRICISFIDSVQLFFCGRTK